MPTRMKLEEGWSTLFLIWAMVFITAVAIMQANLIDGLQIEPLVVCTAILTGVLLAKSRFSANTAHLFAFVYGLFLVFYLVGSILPSDMSWRDRVFDLINRQVIWLGKAFDGGTSRDGLIFVIQTSAIFWLLGYTAAWYTFRKPRVWRAVVPTGIVLLSVVYYYNGPKPLPVYLAIYALLAMMYVARTHLVDQEKSWRAAGVRYERDIWFSFLRAGFLASLLALMIAWSLPTFAANAAVGDALSGTRGPWRRFQDNWTRLFSSLRSYGTSASDPYQDTLVLGGPRSVGNTFIMDVYVPRELPYVYWHAIAYDTYEDGRWFVADNINSTEHYPDDGPLPVPFTTSREVITQTVVNYLPNSSFIYGAPDLVMANRAMLVDATSDGRGGLLVSAVRSRFILRQGDQYQVLSRLSTVDAESLRLASTAYPQWVTDRYLQLPDTITPQTIALAEELTSRYDNPFDKALAVRNYLRANITYNDQIPAPPPDIDPVHYTLFVSQEGYCNYYASAMAVMLRSQGIPARVSSGYAQGEFDPAKSAYRVRASNAHTWVEVYFPQYGWIQFEPTASIPLVERPETGGGGDAFSSPSISQEELDRRALLGEEGLSDELDPRELGIDNNSNITAPATTDGSFLSNIPVWEVVIGVIILGIALGFLLLANEVNKRVESDVTRSYVRLGSWARLLGILFQPAQTPYERADVLVTAVPEGSQPIRNLTQQFVLRQFSARQTADTEFDSLQEWRVLRPLFIRQSVVNRLRRLQRRRK